MPPGLILSGSGGKLDLRQSQSRIPCGAGWLDFVDIRKHRAPWFWPVLHGIPRKFPRVLKTESTQIGRASAATATCNRSERRNIVQGIGRKPSKTRLGQVLLGLFICVGL